MKKRMVLGALLVLVGLVSVGALLMFGVFTDTPEASATTDKIELRMGNKNVDVGDIFVTARPEGLRITYWADTGYDLAEVHVCVWEEPGMCPEDLNGDGPAWSPPGQCQYAIELPAGPPSIPITIPWDDLPRSDLQCGDRVWIQAHAASEDGQTAYGDSFKGNFCLEILCCGF
jgi:hypothetical protein